MGAVQNAASGIDKDASARRMALATGAMKGPRAGQRRGGQAGAGGTSPFLMRAPHFPKDLVAADDMRRHRRGGGMRRRDACRRERWNGGRRGRESVQGLAATRRRTGRRQGDKAGLDRLRDRCLHHLLRLAQTLGCADASRRRAFRANGTERRRLQSDLSGVGGERPGREVDPRRADGHSAILASRRKKDA